MTVKHDKKRYNKTRRSPHIEACQGNPIGRTEPQEQTKESETHLFPPIGVPQNTKHFLIKVSTQKLTICLCL